MSTLSRRLVVWLVLLCSCGSSAQLSDGDSIEVARQYVARFAAVSSSEEPRVFRDEWPSAAGEDVHTIAVWFGETKVRMDGNGRFRSFSNLSATAGLPIGGAPDKYESDEEAWAALDEVLEEFEVPARLYRAELLRGDGSGEPYAYQFVMLERAPSGYKTLTSNSVRAEIHRITGKLIGLSIVDGWTFEPADAQVTPTAAIETVRARYGGRTEDWHATLQYETVSSQEAPQYTRELRANKVLRLYYSVSSSDSRRGYSWVDSKTGEIVQHRVLTPGSVGGHPGSQTKEREEPKSVDSDSASDQAERGVASEPTSDVQAGVGPATVAVPVILLAVAAVFLWQRFRPRRV